jgi:adenine-specific DNA methylase
MTENHDLNEELLIEGSLPVRTLGIECEREGKGIFPPLNRYHIWWARRPLIASRAAVLSSVISNDYMDIEELTERMGITGDTVQKYQTVDDRPDGKLVYEHYGYRRPFTQSTDKEDIEAIHEAARKTWDGELPVIYDPTAGGGAIPFESRRYQFPTIANELNSVASVLLHGVLEHPTYNEPIGKEFKKWGDKILESARESLDGYYPSGRKNEYPVSYLWAHTVVCPDCGLELPLSPNWWLDKQSSNEGTAVRPYVSGDQVDFEIVELTTNTNKTEKSDRFITKDDFNPTDGKGDCLQCGVTIEGDEIKQQAQQKELGYRLFCIEYRDSRSGDRGIYRAPTAEDRNATERVHEKIQNDPDLATFLNEEIPEGQKTDEPRRYGITQWREMFHPRQLLSHYELWQSYEEVKPRIIEEYNEETAKAILTLLAVTADKVIDYNSRLSSWESYSTKVAHTFDRHDFSFKWSFAETVSTAEGAGYSWCLDYVEEVFEELQEYLSHVDEDTPIKILNEDASNTSLEEDSVHAAVMDPPYYDNVMYAELADFFYVWMDKYLRDIYPDLFQTNLTEKDSEAVANPSRYAEVSDGGSMSKSELAENDYESKMGDIFEDVNRVLVDDGVLTIMFTHKKTEAWDTLTKALIEAGFEIHASHPISTENPRSLHQSGKNSAQSTIFLVARHRKRGESVPTLWEDVRSQTREAAFGKAQELDEREVEFSKVDMILASFGPTLEVFTSNYPVVDDEGNPVSPQTALDEARNAVRDFFIDKYLNEGVRGVDTRTEWYILSWLVFEAQRFPYDEARRLAIGIGEDLDLLKKNHRMWRKRSGDVLLRPHTDRVQDINKDTQNRSGRKPVDPDAISFSTDLDKVHAAMHIYDAKGSTEAWNWMNDRNCGSDPSFKATLEALLRVLPHEHDDWQLARDIAAGDTGELLELELDPNIFREEDEDDYQGSLDEF